MTHNGGGEHHDRGRDTRARLRELALQLFAEHLRQLLHGDVDLEHVVARRVACAVTLSRFDLTRLENVADVPVPLASTARIFVTELEARELDRRDRDGDDVLPLLSDHLAFLDVLAEVLLDLAADDPWLLCRL